METLINFFTPKYPDYKLDRNIHEIFENTMNETNMVCVMDCIDKIQYGLYMVNPEGGLYISFLF